MSSKSKKASKNSFLCKNWIKFISSYGISLVNNITHKRLVQILNAPDGITFMTGYRKLAGDVYGDSSLIRMRLMILICHEMKFFTKRLENDLNDFIVNFDQPGEKTRLFFEKYCTQAKRIHDGDILAFANDFANLSVNDQEKVQEFIQKEQMIIKIPQFIISFLTFVDDEQYKKLPPGQQTLFDIISNHDMKGDSDFISTDLALEAADLNDAIVSYFLKLKEFESQGKDTSHIPDIFTSIAKYASDREHLLLMNIIPDAKQNIAETSKMLIMSLERVGKRFKGEEGPECTEEENTLIEQIDKRVNIMKKAESDKLKNLINPISSMYNIMYGQIGMSYVDAVHLLMKQDKEAGLSFLFCMFVGISSVCQWWCVFEGVNRSLNKWLPFLDAEREAAQQEIASSSSDLL